MSNKVTSSRITRATIALALLAIGLGVLAGCGGGGSSTGDGGGSGEVSTGAIELPDEIGGMKSLVAEVEAQNPSAKTVESQTENQEHIASETAAAYSKAFDGAATAYRAYADPKLLKMPYVIAVRAEAPGMTIGPVEDPKYLGLAKPEREVQSVGEVECQIVWSPPVTEGNQPDPESELTTNCQRSGSGASVFVGSAGYTGPNGLKSLAGFTEAAWEAVAEEG